MTACKPFTTGLLARMARIAVCWLAMSLTTVAQAREVQIVSQGARPTSLDGISLRAMFSVRVRTWPDGTPVKVFVLPDEHPIHQKFCRERLGTFPYVLRSSWDRLVFTGTGIAPEVVTTEEEMLRKVSQTRGAIGYVMSPSATQAARASGLTGGPEE